MQLTADFTNPPFHMFPLNGWNFYWLPLRYDGNWGFMKVPFVLTTLVLSTTQELYDPYYYNIVPEVSHRQPLSLIIQGNFSIWNLVMPLNLF